MSKMPQPMTQQMLKTLTDPVRRRLFDFVFASGKPVGRDEAAAAAGISRTLAAYHLDNLGEAGLLAISYARPQGKTGPGAGRPAKLYAPAHQEMSLNVPPRNYRLLGSLLATAAASDDSGVVLRALLSAARSEGIELGESGADLLDLLRDLGYEPVQEENGDITMANCPFHLVARHQTEMVCSMNRELLSGVLTGCRCDARRAELNPAEGRCCVVIHPEA
ncbi:transcriptional regulator [Glutamicibacter protophormiae]|uniref:helix-turn-helix transcriptional regulator n=1 Tax=Glutamicibacter protophormiae TaxID=37930 RepID=UPI002A83B1AF|nr:helix-turn-helix domain-containing protein [Glutamicibacter protophormiae]WPR66002.1 transcriptional regulator [Glutamicibacter protophormiae]WPR69500.1 transcriptional regulator [Glutamicibacter protophormiae]